MDNNVLMRRISAATDIKREAPSPAPVAAPPPVYVSTPKPAAQPSHVLSMLKAAEDAAGGAAPQAPMQAAAPAPVQQAQPQMANPVAPAPTPAPTPASTPGAPISTSPQAQAPISAPSMQTPMPQAAVPQSPVIPQAPLAPQSPAMPQVDNASQTGVPYDTAAAATPVAPQANALSFAVSENMAAAPTASTANPSAAGPLSEAYVVACNGNMAMVQGDTSCVDTLTGLTWAVGRMLSIAVGEARVVGMICDIVMPEGSFTQGTKSLLHFQVELQGEVKGGHDGTKLKFVKGITNYPGVGSTVTQISSEDLASIYAATGTMNGFIGHLSQDDSIPAYVDVPDMLSKHFAVLGSTGSGKSASVSLLLHCAQEIVPDLRTIILDPHNEYDKAFPGANVIRQTALDIPFWMFQLEEYVEVLFRGKPIIDEEVDCLRELIPEAKSKFRDGEDRVKLRSGSGSEAFTADTACPYRIADLLSLIDDELGLLESRFDKATLKSLKARVVSHGNDARYAFMFRHRTIEDIAESVIGGLFNLPGNGNFTSIVQMAGMPVEIVNAVATVLCRLSFELAIAAKGNMKVLVVCEEAHRYVPAGKDGFEPARRAIARIAKEGRKYGSFMAIISQRPSELDPTILSQCSTVFALRLTNDFDQEIIRKAISSSSASTISFISSLANQECIAFGEGMSTPMRLKFRTLPAHWLPGAESDVFGNSNPVVSGEDSATVFRQWRFGAA